MRVPSWASWGPAQAYGQRLVTGVVRLTGGGAKPVVSFLVLASLLAVAQPGTVDAQQLIGSGLSVSPNRVIFEGRDRFHQLTLLNRGDAAVTYRVSLITVQMDENGRIRRVENKGQFKDASRIIRYAPRRVKLGPGQGQIIRLSVRKPQGLEEGEYRSAMLVAAVPDEDAKPQAKQTDGQIAIQVSAYFAVSIPVMVRHGKLFATSKAEGLELLPADKEKGLGDRAVTNLLHEGNRTTYGDAVLRYHEPGGGEPVVVGQVLNTGIYPPLTKRKLVIPLRLPDGVVLKSGGKLELTYTDKPREGDEATPPSKASLVLR